MPRGVVFRGDISYLKIFVNINFTFANIPKL